MHISQAAGGVERYLKSLIKYLNHEKFENILVCSQDYDEENFKGITDDFTVVYMQRKIGVQDLRAVLKVRKLIKKYNPDIVYAHSSKAGAIARLANIGLHKKCIYNPHGWAFNMQVSGKKRRIYTMIERIMAAFCQRIICISEAEKKSALDKKICSAAHLKVILNGIDIKNYDEYEHNNLARADIGIPEDALVVGMVGRLSDQKAPDVFIRMARQIINCIPNACFIIVGSGEMQKDIENYAKKHGILEAVHITGWVNNPLSYIALFDIAVLLSRWEGFGLAIPEYMLCKKPIVATDVDAIHYLIQDHVNGLLVPVDDSKAACEAVLEIYNDSDLKGNLIAQGTKDVYEKYDARRVSEEHEILFCDLCR